MKSPFQNQIPATFIIIDLYWSKDKDFWSMNKTTTFTIQDYNKTQKNTFYSSQCIQLERKPKHLKYWTMYSTYSGRNIPSVFIEGR